MLERIGFDFEKHGKSALKDYLRVRSRYVDLSAKIASILKEALARRNLIYHSIMFRAKSEESFEEKAKLPDPENPKEPRYNDPLNDITDKAGVRVITYLIKTQDEIDEIIFSEFDVTEKIDRAKEMLESEKFGYLSVHYLVKLKEPRLSLTEYVDFRNMVCEIQVRTILQHAWAEIEHNIKYKSNVDIPPGIRRRFIGIAGVLENADREFQFIHDEDKRLREELQLKIQEGKVEQIDISSTSVRLLLDQMYGVDLRVSEWTYSWLAKLILRLGVKGTDELRRVLEQNTDYELLYKHFWDVRPSPPTIAEDVLFLHFKERYIENHPWSDEEWFVKRKRTQLTDIFGTP